MHCDVITKKRKLNCVRLVVIQEQAFVFAWFMCVKDGGTQLTYGEFMREETFLPSVPKLSEKTCIVCAVLLTVISLT